jgi:large subunit ribosomal protein L11
MASNLVKINKTIRLTVPAAKAKPSPAIGQALGALGVNMMTFLKQFNAKSAEYVDELPTRTRLTVYTDNSFDFTTKAPATTYYLKKAACVDTCANNPGHEIAGVVHIKQIYEIAKLKQSESEILRNTPLEGICRSLISSCKSAGLRVSYKKDVSEGYSGPL